MRSKLQRIVAISSCNLHISSCLILGEVNALKNKHRDVIAFQTTGGRSSLNPTGIIRCNMM